MIMESLRLRAGITGNNSRDVWQQAQAILDDLYHPRRRPVARRCTTWTSAGRTTTVNIALLTCSTRPIGRALTERFIWRATAHLALRA